jgi:hypothetical protein
MKKLMLAFIVLGFAAVVNADVFFGTNVVYRSGTASTGTLRVRYIDYDGTILSSQLVATNGNATAPSNPSHDLLTFTGWNNASTNITQNTDIGATYDTTDGKTYAYLTVSTATGTNCTLYLIKSDSSALYIAWGDGTIMTNSSTGNFNTGAHAYPSNGNYICTLWLTNSSTYGFGNNSAGVSFVGGSAQTNRSMLTSCLIGTNVTSIGASAFYTCSALSSVVIPNSVTSIGAEALNYCYSLSSVTIPNSVTTIGNSAFSACYALSSVTIPNSVTSIGDYAFSSCYSLTSVVIPNSVATIRINTLYYCYSLSSVVIPNSVATIGADAFNNCYALSSVTIPNSVTTIGASAFSSCRAVRFYNFTPTNPPTLASINVFGSITASTKIYVPDASYAIYTNAAVWKTSPIPLTYIYPVSQKP